MLHDIPGDLSPYLLAPFFIIIHCSFFKKFAFLKDNRFFFKGQNIFLKGLDAITPAKTGIEVNCPMHFELRARQRRSNISYLSIERNSFDHTYKHL